MTAILRMVGAGRRGRNVTAIILMELLVGEADAPFNIQSLGPQGENRVVFGTTLVGVETGQSTHKAGDTSASQAPSFQE